jgi:hypothetical protein
MEMQTADQLSFLAAAGAATTGDYGDRAFADGQWKCRRNNSGSAAGDPGIYYPLGLASTMGMEMRTPSCFLADAAPAPGYYGSWASGLG